MNRGLRKFTVTKATLVAHTKGYEIQTVQSQGLQRNLKWTNVEPFTERVKKEYCQTLSNYYSLWDEAYPLTFNDSWVSVYSNS